MENTLLKCLSDLLNEKNNNKNHVIIKQIFPDVYSIVLFIQCTKPQALNYITASTTST